MKIIETHGLSKTYVRDFLGIEYGRVKLRLKNRRVRALQDLSLSVEEGEIFGLLGPNGAGKTTTIKILMGIHFATKGSAWLMGRPLGDVEVRREIGFLPENPYFYDYLKGWEFLDFYGLLYGMPRRKRRKRIEELLDLVGLTDAANLPLKGYSKGMNQRIGLAQALLNDPRLVILDEPQSGLDPLGRKEVRDIIIKLRSEGRTILFSSHILSDAQMICDRVGILYKGSLINVGKVQELIATKAEEFELVVGDLDSDTAEELRSGSHQVVESEDRMMLLYNSEEACQRAIRKTLESGGRVITMNPRMETLEEYFIRQVKGDVA